MASRLLRWWNARATWEQVALVGTSGLVIGTAVGYVVDRRRDRKWTQDWGFSPYYELPDLIDYETENEHEIEEPPGIDYDENDEPCPAPPVPWAVPSGPDDVASLRFGETYCTPEEDLEPKQRTPVEFAEGGPRPLWPVKTDAKRKLAVSYQDVRGKWHGRWGRAFGAPRKRKGGGDRVHAGIDLFGDPGDPVVATESGVVIAELPFYKGTSALYLETDSGVIVNYGELDRNSWRDFGVKVGDRVDPGDKLARIGLSDDGSHMLHLETYEPYVTVKEIRQGKMQWEGTSDPPDGLLDPTRYLVRAQRNKYENLVEET
jgi:murein DD-endopeptidase MepM/ murein hydrolase activator NlpD